jgi:hypothetical protein
MIGRPLPQQKVASASGDMRKALGVCRLALSIAVAEAHQAAKGPVVEPPSTPSPTKRAHSTPTKPSNQYFTSGSPSESVEDPENSGRAGSAAEAVRGTEGIVSIRDSSGKEVLLENWRVELGHMAEALSQSFTLPVIQGIQNLPQHHQVSGLGVTGWVDEVVGFNLISVVLRIRRVLGLLLSAGGAVL